MAGGWAVTELWESRAAAEAFYQQVLAPMVQAAGVGALMPQFHPLHNLALARNG